MHSPTPTDDHTTPTDDLKLSQDATVVLALARTALPFARTRTEEAERWLRVMRMHDHVGAALQGLGVGEGPLDAPSEEPAPPRFRDSGWARARSTHRARSRRRRRPGGDRRRTADTIELVSCRAMDFARQSGGTA